MFVENTLQNTNNAIQLIIQKSSNMLYDHYILNKLPQHAKQSNTQFLQNIIDNGMQIADRETGIKVDPEAIKINNDAFSVKAAQITRIKRNKKLLVPQINTLYLKKTNSTNEKSQNNIKINNPEGSDQKDFIPLVEILSQFSEIQLQDEDKLRKRKIKQQQHLKQTERLKLQRISEMQNQDKNIKKQFDEIKKKHSKFTYDFNGKFVICDPKAKHLFNPHFNLNMKVKIINEKSANSERHNASASNVQIYNIAKKISPIGDPDSSKNKLYNNNNSRQLSNLSYIQLVQGSKLIETQNQNVLVSSKRFNSTKKQFLEQIKESKFKSFFKNYEQNNSSTDNFDSGIMNPEQASSFNKNISSTSTKHGKSFAVRSPFNSFKFRSNYQKPLTAGTTSLRTKSEFLRRNDKHNGNSKIIIENKSILQDLYLL